MVYTCTEDIEENGKIFAYSIESDGELKQIGQVDAGGTSTCYLTIDREERNLLAVNYWDSTLVSIPLSTETGEFMGGVKSKYDPKYGKGMVAATKCAGGANHSNNDESTIQQRQADPHSHALVLDPYVGCVAYVPCLGKDLIREFHYDVAKGSIEREMNFLPSGLCTGHPDGPRYICFHPRMPIAYVVNELSSTVSLSSEIRSEPCATKLLMNILYVLFFNTQVAVFSVDKDLIQEIHLASKANENMDRFKGKSTLRLIQSITTIPSAFPKQLNTCGRICIHNSGRFVIVSNRGHQSIAILRVNQRGTLLGQLNTVGYFHTRGETPRHFKFDSSGQYLIVANQDSDNLSIFNFNQSSGEIKFTGNEYQIPSPNFICCCTLHNEEGDGSVSSNELDLVPESVSNVKQVSTSTVDAEELKKQLIKAREEVSFIEKQLALVSHEL